MAWLELDPDSQRYKVCFRFGGKRFKKSLKTGNQSEAEILAGGVEKTLLRLEQGLIELPEGADILSFVLSDGKRQEKPKATRQLTLEGFFQQYREKLPAGAMEANSLDTVKLHMSHLQRHLGKRFAVQGLTLADLQTYVDLRSREKGHRKRPISPITIKKEVTSFSGIWTWGIQMGLVKGAFPNRGLKYPKTTEKPPFQTWEEIERQIAAGGMTEREQKELWDCLFLTLPQIEELLKFIQENAGYPFLYPMAVFAAHTGARRSEMMRSRISDFDFAGRTVLIHEKKRAKGKRTSRRVPLSPRLAEVMRDWFARHPGGLYTLCQELHVARSSKTRSEYVPLTRNEANHHFQRLLAGSKWEKVRGWHVFRHSFASNCAAKGVDQRLIDAWMGHQTEEMRKRYRHLIPSQQQQAIQLVFANG
jgi:integrase